MRVWIDTRMHICKPIRMPTLSTHLRMIPVRLNSLKFRLTLTVLSGPGCGKVEDKVSREGVVKSEFFKFENPGHDSLKLYIKYMNEKEGG